VYEDLQTGTLEAACENPWFASHPFHSITKFAAKVRDIATTHIAQFNAFQLRPDTLPGIQFRRIGRQALQVQALGRPICEELLDEMTAMDRGAIPDDHHTAGHFTQQVFQESDHSR
jgi:hypothetical protein